MSEDVTLLKLLEELANLDQQYNSTYTTPESIYALQKTMKSFNITITDWNVLIDYAHTLGSTYKALYKLIPDIIQYLVDEYNRSIAESGDFGASLSHSLAGDANSLTLVLNMINGLGQTIDTETQTFTSATTSAAGLMSADDKMKLDALYTALGNLLSYQGTLTVAQINSLDTTSLKIGYIYNVSDSGIITLDDTEVTAGDNVVWNGTSWDRLVGEYYNKSESDVKFQEKADYFTVGNGLVKENDELKSLIETSTVLINFSD